MKRVNRYCAVFPNITLCVGLAAKSTHDNAVVGTTFDFSYGITCDEVGTSDMKALAQPAELETQRARIPCPVHLGGIKLLSTSASFPSMGATL
jgi:hypothetical protein